MMLVVVLWCRGIVVMCSCVGDDGLDRFFDTCDVGLHQLCCVVLTHLTRLLVTRYSLIVTFALTQLGPSGARPIIQAAES
jgi:hypothetical protein